MPKVTAQARQELIKAIRARYLASSALEKRWILDEFVALTGYHRKHALRVLRAQRPDLVSRSPRSRVYDEVVREALVVCWEASNRVCGKRLKPLLPVLVPALENHGHLSLDEGVRRRVLAASAATIDRLLEKQRAAAPVRRRKRRARPQRIPVRTVADGEQPESGYLQIDLVAHCGDNAAGRFAYTLVLTDVASGWTECAALLAGEGTLVVDGLDRLRTAMPFRLRGIDGDRGSDLIGEAVLAYCGKHQIELTYSRPRRKNDRAGASRSSGSVVRRLVGQGRLEGLRAVEALERLYAASRQFVNFFQPSFKLAGRQRVGARVSKRYRSPETPCARLLASPVIDETTKAQLRTVLATLDPRRLLDEIRTVQQHLVGLSVRPVYRAGPKPPRSWRTRVDPFAEVWPRVVTWLEREPDRPAKELLQRLRDEGFGQFPDRQLRTLQRRVKEWRRAIKPV